MSVQAISWVLNESRATLGSRLVLLSIANHADANGINSWPSIPMIAGEARVSERQAQRCIRALEKLGELIVSRGQGYRGSHRFEIVGAWGVNMSPKGVTSKARRGDIRDN